MRTLKSFALLLCGIGFACSLDVAPYAPILDPRAVRMSPPPVYARWWAMTEACSRRSGDFSNVNWYMVPGSGVFLNGDQVHAYFAPFENRIVIAETAIYDGGTVRHEMLHAIHQSQGHSRDDFLSRCGGVVHCTGACVIEAGPPPAPDPTSVSVSSTEFTVDFRLVPDRPGIVENDSVFTIVVTAKNPRTTAVALDTAGGNGQHFSFRLNGSNGERSTAMRIHDAGVMRFAPGEIKQQLFDLVVASTPNAVTIAPGSYSITVGYERHFITKDGIRIGQ